MAKAAEPAKVGDQVEIIKDDDNAGKIGNIVALLSNDGFTVKFSDSANEYDYYPDEVILYPTDEF